MLSITRIKERVAALALTAEADDTEPSRCDLSGPSPEAIGKAINETEKQVNGIMLAFVGAAAFCVLSLLTPDSALLGSSEKVNVPLAGPVSFVGFMIIGPAVLVLLRAYLGIYIEHGKRLACIAPVERDPILLSSQNAFLRVAFALILYPLLPLTLFMFAWKAAVFPGWGAGLLCVAIAATVVHLEMPSRRLSCWSKATLSLGAGLISAGLIAVVGVPRRPFDLFRADLANQWLVGRDLTHANLAKANLKGADLRGALFEGAYLFDAHLEHADLGQAHLDKANLRWAHLDGAQLLSTRLDGADLTEAHLDGANLWDAHLEGAYFWEAHLDGANLQQAHLDGAKLNRAHLDGADLHLAEGLTQNQITEALGNAATKLPFLYRPRHWTEPGAGSAPAP